MGHIPSLSLSLSAGEPLKRRTMVSLQDPSLHRLLWQRSNQSDLWVMDDVTVTVEECPRDNEWCQFGRVTEDFNGTLKYVLLMVMSQFFISPFPCSPLLWNGDSFPDSSSIGPYSCSDLSDPSLLVPPGDQIISRPLLEPTTAVIFGVEFPYPSPLCRPGTEYSPVELRQCRSIEGVLGECVLIALVSISGDSHVTFENDHMTKFPHRLWELPRPIDFSTPLLAGRT